MEMKPHYQRIATDLKAEGFDLQLAMIDCDLNGETAHDYGVSVFPTFKLFINGKYVADYEGENNKDAMKKFVLAARNRKQEL